MISRARTDWNEGTLTVTHPNRSMPAAMLLAALLSGCAAGGDPASGNVDDTNLLGHGSQITEVSPTIYRVRVKLSMGASVETARNQAMLKASELTLAKGYQRFEIVGGDGFRRVPGKVQAGPLPISLYTEPDGSIQIRLIETSEPERPGQFDAAVEKARLTALGAAG
jgi:hypothetical protein